ncbi:MAG: hypothetical protein AAF497_05175 [Planctomycetota bacterium]
MNKRSQMAAVTSTMMDSKGKSIMSRITLIPLLMLASWTAFVPTAFAELSLPNIFGDNMVIQRDRPIHIWGTATAGKNVRVKIGTRDLTERADENGRWSMQLEGLRASNQATSLSVQSGEETVEYDGIVFGDVWLLGGQSNMEDVLADIYHGDMEVASANHPDIRLMTIPHIASPKRLDDMDRLNEFNSWTRRYELKGSWRPCTPKSVERFSAIGYIFGRRLHLVTGVPIGLIDASWGGTTVEAWTSREKLATVDGARPLVDEWESKIAAYDAEASLQRRIENWERDSERRKKDGKKPHPKPTEPDQDPATNRNNPGASYNGMIAPWAGLNIKGAIFNQGYNNALGHNSRPRLYGNVIKAMIEDWRVAFRDEKMPFGIVALTAGGEPQTRANFELRMVDPAPFIREAQAKAWQEMENVGFAPAYDQQVPWYHPHKKFELGERIARWALFTQYGFKNLGWQPAVCTGSEVDEDHIVLSFDRNIRAHDGRPFEGFAIAGEDRHFYPATAEFVVTGKDDRGRDQLDESKLRVSSPLVTRPVAVRYAWARNPLGNAVNSRHHERTIPVVSFRTDDWDWPESPFKAEDDETQNKHRRQVNQLRDSAREWMTSRRIEEAREVLESAESR